MDTWTLQRGYPLVTLKRSVDGTTVEATQKIFLQRGKTLEEEEYGNLGYAVFFNSNYAYI